MSRALDPAVKEALKNGNHQSVFEDISGVLTPDCHDELLEIEILGSGFPLSTGESYLRDGNAIAVPKLRLVQAFIVARHTLFKYIQDESTVPQEQVLLATAVMLLMDPEHLTAANTRKRIIVNAATNQGYRKTILYQDKHLVDSLLTSRLHRHTKSPTLWSHRRWLMRRFFDAGLDVDVEGDMRRIVLVSGERHPKNYYGWLHARFLINCIGDADGEKAQRSRATIVTDVKKWCFSHHDDVSGWSFLAFLLDRWPRHAEEVVSETLQLAKSFHWRNESVWYFLRNVMATHRSSGELPVAFDSVRGTLLATAKEKGLDHRHLEQAANWLDIYGTSNK